MKKTTLKIWLENAWVPVMPETDSRVVHMGETGKSLELWAQEHSEVFGNHTTEFKAFKATMGQPGGIATLNESGQIPSTQLPSYVDDVIEGTFMDSGDGTQRFYAYDDTHGLESITPTSGKIYIDTVTGLSYRWASNSQKFIPISSPVELGTGVEQAYPGNLGQANADAIAAIKADYIKSTDYATEQKVGVVRADKNYGILVSTGGLLLLSPADNNNINNRTYLKPIDAGNLDYAIKAGLTTNRLTLSEDSTDESGNEVEGDKTKACKWLGAVRDNQYATNDKAGVGKVHKYYGIYMQDDFFAVNSASNWAIDNRNDKASIGNDAYFVPITRLDYSVLSALTTNSLTPTDEQLKAFYKWIGAVQYYYEARNGIARFINGQLIVNTPTDGTHAAHKSYVDGRTLQYENVVYCDLEDVDDSDYTYNEVYFRFCTQSKLTITDTAALAKALYDNGFTSVDKAAIVHHNEGTEGGYSTIRPILLYSADGNTFTLVTKGGTNHIVTMSEMYLVSTKRF